MEHLPEGEAARLVLGGEAVFAVDDCQRRLAAVVVELDLTGELGDLLVVADGSQHEKHPVGRDVMHELAVGRFGDRRCRCVGSDDDVDAPAAGVRTEDADVAGALLPHVDDHADHQPLRDH